MTTRTGNALITGASSGIGREVARQFAHDGYGLVLVARDGGRLDSLAAELSSDYGVDVRAIALDLSLPNATSQLFELLQYGNRHIDCLVNNAGFGLSGSFSETSLEAELDMIQVNLVAVTRLTKLLLPGMIARGTGKILNVASTAAFQPGPLMAVYYASKAYVLSFSEALSTELRGSGVSVTVLCPGPTQTRFQRRAGLQGSRLFAWGVMRSDRVAAIGYQALMCRHRICIPGLRNRWLARSVRFAPRGWVPPLVQWLQGPRECARASVISKDDEEHIGTDPTHL